MQSAFSKTKRLRQSTISFSSRKSLCLATDDHTKHPSTHTSQPLTTKPSKLATGKAKKKRKRKVSTPKAVRVKEETEEEKERKRQQRIKAEEKERERQERERLQREQHQAQLAEIRAVFAGNVLYAAVLRLIEEDEHPDSTDDEGDERNDEEDSDDSDGDQVARAMEDAASTASTASSPSIPPLLSPSSSSASSSSDDISTRASASPDAAMDNDDSVPLSAFQFRSSRSRAPSSLMPLLPRPPSSLSSSYPPTYKVNTSYSSSIPCIDFDLERDFPSLLDHALYWKIAGACLPPPSLFTLPGTLSAQCRPDQVPAYKQISRNKGKGGAKVRKERKRRDDEEEGEALCGCMARTAEQEQSERLRSEAREERFRRGEQTAEDERWQQAEARRRAAQGDEDYLHMQRRSSTVYNCGDGCLNAALLIECDDRNCSVGAELCRNRHFARNECALLEPFRTELKGWGLRAVEDIKPGTFLIEYVGEVIDNAECHRRIAKEDARVKVVRGKLERERLKRAKSKRRAKPEEGSSGTVKAPRRRAADEPLASNYYFMQVSDDVVIDAARAGSVARFINHSCNANCLIGKWTVSGDIRIAIFTQRAVVRGEELTIDYKYDRIGLEYQPCYCGEPNCARWIGAKKQPSTPEAAGSGAGEGRKGKKKKLSRGRLKELAFDRADEVCAICGDGGDVVLCDGRICGAFCPRVYHLDCVQLDAAPKGGWFCPWHYCDALKAAQDGQPGQEENCGRRAEQFCVGCCRSRCRAHRSDGTESGAGWRCVSWRASELRGSGVLDMERRDWLREEEDAEWRWVLCEECQGEGGPWVLSQAEDRLYREKFGATGIAGRHIDAHGQSSSSSSPALPASVGVST